MLFSRQKSEMVTPGAALPGRTDQTMPVPSEHFINGHPLTPPWPTGYQTASRTTLETRPSPPNDSSSRSRPSRSRSALSKPRTTRAVPARVWTSGEVSTPTLTGLRRPRAARPEWSRRP